MGDMKSTMDQVAVSVQELALHATTLADVVTQTNQQGERAKENMKHTVAVASQGRSDSGGRNPQFGRGQRIIRLPDLRYYRSGQLPGKLYGRADHTECLLYSGQFRKDYRIL